MQKSTRGIGGVGNELRYRRGVPRISGPASTVQAIRNVEAVGEPIINLGGGQSADQVLSDSFSEDWPDLVLYDLGGVHGGMHRGAGSQLIYNRESNQSLFLGALTSDRFLTLMHLKAERVGAKTKIASYTVESTGTTEIQKEFDLKDSPADDQIELSLPVKPGEDGSRRAELFASACSWRKTPGEATRSHVLMRALVRGYATVLNR